MSLEPHPDFAPLGDSWELAVRADGYSLNTLGVYRQSLTHFARWLATGHPDTGPADVDRNHIRGWVVHMRDTVSSNTGRARFTGVRHFFRWMLEEGERTTTPFDGVRTPAPGQPHTPVLTDDAIRSLLGTCASSTLVDRRDTAIIMILADGGLRLSELAGLGVDDVDIRDRVLFVIGKGTNRSGPRRRAVPIGIKAARSLDRYLRERRKHAYAEKPGLWLGSNGHPTLAASGIQSMLARRGKKVGLTLHPHMFRHTWASEFRMAGGEEGDLMVLGGWRSRQMLDRYGKAAAADRARESYRTRSLGDRL